MGTAAKLILMTKMHSYTLMETFVTINHMIANIIYTTCCLEEQSRMVQLYANMKYIRKLKSLAIVVLKPSNIIHEWPDLNSMKDF